MKRNLFGIALMSLGALFACSEQDQEMGIKDNATQSVEFEVNVMDLITKSSDCGGQGQGGGQGHGQGGGQGHGQGGDQGQGGSEGGCGGESGCGGCEGGEATGDVQLNSQACLDQEQLQDVASAGDLEARFVIDGRTEDGSNVIVRKIRYIASEDKFIAEPYDLPSGQTWELKTFTVWQNNAEDGENLLYSAVSNEEDSEFESFLKEEDGELLPHELTICGDEQYDKTTHPVTVVCATDMNPTAFGYKMWDMNFVRFQKVPFMFNVCDNGEDMHSVLSGKLEIREDANKYNNVYDEGDVLKTIYFNAGDVNKLYIMDRLSEDDATEFYGYKVYERTQDNGAAGSDAADVFVELKNGSASVSELTAFKNSDAWMDEHTMLDVNLCNPEGTEDWIYGEE